MSDRGEFRSFYTSIIDDPDWQQLPDSAKSLLFTLKHALGPAGIGIVHMRVLEEQLNCDQESLAARFECLEEKKPMHDRGWIVRDRNVVWLVHGLKFEGHLSAGSKNHRAFIENQIRPLGDEKPIVRAFRSYYADWFSPAVDPPKTGGVEGFRRGSEGVADNNLQPTTDNRRESVQLVADPASVFVRTLITSLNQGMTDNSAIGDRMNPVPHGHGLSVQAGLEIRDGGVDLEFAKSVVYDKARAFRPSGRNKQISTLSYLSAAVLGEWEKEQAGREATRTSRPAPRSPKKRPESNYSNATEGKIPWAG